MACRCIDRVNRHLHNQGIDTKVAAWTGTRGPRRTGVQTHQIVKGQAQPAKSIVAEFCPFCGKPYNPVEPVEDAWQVIHGPGRTKRGGA